VRNVSYLRQINKLKRAVVLAAYVRHHSATYSIEVDRANKLLKQLNNAMSSDKYFDSFEKGIHLSDSQAIETVNQVLYIIPNDNDNNTVNDLHPHDPLTERELDVLALLGEGRSNREIAEELIVTVGTIKSHVHNLCQKLGVKNRTQAVLEAKHLGLL
jgi:ATP/maltotriose-dependent transcriptional regulator MalT